MLEHNDMGPLREALHSGAWHHLRGPARERGWSTELAIVQSCSRRLALDALEADPEAPEHVLAWGQAVGSKSLYGVELWLRHRRESSSLNVLVGIVLVGVLPERHPTALLALARRAVARWPRPEREAALVVLEGRSG